MLCVAEHKPSKALHRFMVQATFDAIARGGGTAAQALAAPELGGALPALAMG